MSMMLCWLLGTGLAMSGPLEAPADSQELVLVVYPVADLLFVEYDQAGQPILRRGDCKTTEDELIRLITTKIAPDSWASVGGPGVVQYFPLGMSLVVNQTRDVQEQVQQRLAAIRARIKEQQCQGIEEKLDSRVGRVHFKDVPLRQAIADLGVLSGLNFVADEIALRNASVSLDEPLMLDVERVSLRSALNLLLKQVHLTYVVKDGAVVITAPAVKCNPPRRESRDCPIPRF